MVWIIIAVIAALVVVGALVQRRLEKRSGSVSWSGRSGSTDSSIVNGSWTSGPDN